MITIGVGNNDVPTLITEKLPRQAAMVCGTALLSDDGPQLSDILFALESDIVVIIVADLGKGNQCEIMSVSETPQDLRRYHLYSSRHDACRFWRGVLQTPSCVSYHTGAERYSVCQRC